MARHPFGGTVWDWVMARHQSSPLAPVVAALQVTRVSFFDAESGGNAVLDLQDSAGAAVVAIDTDENGFLPTFYGPNNVTTMWADAGSGDRRLMVARDSMGPEGRQGDPGVADDPSLTAVLEDPESQARSALAIVSADKSVQVLVEAGRLADEVLSARFQQSRIVIPATQMVAATGTPTMSLRGAFWPTWLLDANVAASVACMVTVPASWAKFDVIVRGMNGGAGAGDVRLRTLHMAHADGEDVTTGSTTANVTVTAGAQNVRQSATARTGLTADSTKTNIIRVERVAADAADTLTNVYAISAIELVATSFVTFVPTPPVEPEATAVGANFFTKASNADLAGLRVFQQAPPPADDTIDATYPYWPVTDAATSQNFATSTWAGGNRWSFLWSDRRNYGDAWNKKPNQLPAPVVKIGTQECRAVFTTIARANAATQAKIRFMLGNDAATYQAPWIAAGGSAGDFVTDAAFRANPATYCTTDFAYGSATYKVMVDKVLLPAPRFVDGNRPDLQPGVVLDYEVGDSRTTTETTNFINAVAADVHAAGRQLFLLFNPLNNVNQLYHGYSAANLPAILAAADFLTLTLWSGNPDGSLSASYANQLALLGGGLSAADYAKLVINFELGNPGTSLADAQWVHDKLREAGTSHPGKVMFWRNFAAVGGPGTTLTNQKIAAVVAP